MDEAQLELPPEALPIPPVVAPGHDFASVTATISDVVLERAVTHGWLACMLVAALLVTVLTAAVTYLFLRGVGIWGIDIPVAWGFAIANFVWWIGIGHAGTFISAILYLLRQEWRTSINRFAEAMTLFAVACAGMFPLLHLGRPWFFYWLFPYPNTMELWPQWLSPLVWDVFAVGTYATVSLLFWYLGMVPDLATLRDRASHRVAQVIYGILALGWRGAARHWERYQMAYLLLAGLATPLVISVHSVVGMDFAYAQLPGWHSTIFPPYFVAGAIFSGFAMVLTLAIPMRKVFHLEDFITRRQLDNCAKLMLVTGLIVAYGYIMEAFMGWYGQEPIEAATMYDRSFGNYAIAYWVLIFCNVLTPQLLWIGKIRRNVPLLFVISIIVQVGMWMERFVIVIQSLSHAHTPSRFGMYFPTQWDWATLLGTIGFFCFCFFLFVRLLPVISISEMRELVHRQKHPHTLEEQLAAQPL
jgi:molybdopterin-containing oxidoreductase family membrane subunit